MDKAILQLLNITCDTPLALSTDGTSLVISPVKDDEVMRAYGGVKKRFPRKSGKTTSSTARAAPKR